MGTINLHTGKLPEYRGRHAIQWALINGEKEIGITIHFINENIDQGDIILQDCVPIERNDTLKMIQKKITPKAASLVVAAVKQLKEGCVYRRKQDERLSSFHRKRKPRDGKVDWSKSGVELSNLINALIFPVHDHSEAQAWAKRKSGKKIRFYGTVRGDCPGEVLGKLSQHVYVIATVDSPIVVRTSEPLTKGQVLI
jgi:methionyl-tRNA formyltransferase